MWADVYSQLSCANAVNIELALYYPRHLDIPILCSGPYDFERKSPKGRCSLLYNRRLELYGH